MLWGHSRRNWKNVVEKRREEKKVGDINYRRNCYLVDGLMGGYICM
mgnify:CR=1 FL=1|tara:strand:- start:1842 stop:1979 length:138 start_codon:yes stop_codon:yes gene_type:complete